MLRDWLKIARHANYLQRPGYALRIGVNFFRRLVLRRPVLRSIELAVTYDCQAQCAKCYAGRLRDPQRAYLTLAEIAAVADQAMLLGTIHLNLTGGEAILRPDITAIVRACHPRQLMVQLTTNGMAVTRDKLVELRAAGLNALNVSIDTTVAGDHDRGRVLPGCHAAAVQAVRWARELGLTVCVSTVYARGTRAERDNLERLLAFAAEERVWLLICDAAAVGGWQGERENMLTPAERTGMLREMLRHPQARHHTMYNFRGRAGCPAAHEKLYITAYGDVTPCDYLHGAFGNVRTEPLAVVWQRMRRDPRFSEESTACRMHTEMYRGESGPAGE